jgi:hypothetical protein
LRVSLMVWSVMLVLIIVILAQAGIHSGRPSR